jgi:hypothetical protein
MDDDPSEIKRKRNVRLGIDSDKLKIYDYDEALDSMLANKANCSHPVVPSLFVGWDNTPRRGENGIIIINSTPKKFGDTLHKLVLEVQDREPEERLVFVNAWNEWAEGNYLEPDIENGLAYLEATLQAVKRELRG